MNKTEEKTEVPAARYDFMLHRDDGYWYAPKADRFNGDYRVIRENVDGQVFWQLQQKTINETTKATVWFFVEGGTKRTLKDAVALAKRLVGYKETIVGFTYQDSETGSRWLSKDNQFVIKEIDNSVFTIWQYKPNNEDDKWELVLVSGHPIESLKKCKFFVDLIKKSGLGVAQQAIARYNLKRKGKTKMITETIEIKKNKTTSLTSQEVRKFNEVLGFQTEADIKVEVIELQRQLVEIKALHQTTSSKWNKLKGEPLRYATQVGVFYLVAESIADNEWRIQLYTEQGEKISLCSKRGEFLEAIKQIDNHAGTGFIALFKARKERSASVVG